MKRKFFCLISTLLLISFAGIFITSCSSGFNEDKGEVSFTFTQTMLSKMLARSASSRSGTADYSSGFSTPENMLYEFGGLSNDGDTLLLYILRDNTYAIYSTKLMKKISSAYEGMSPEEILDLPEYQNAGTNPYSVLDRAICSKGSWSASNDEYITIKETSYYDSSSETLKEVSSSTEQSINLRALSFTYRSYSGSEMTFYADNSSYEENEYQDKEYEVVPKIKVELKTSGRTYEKEVDIIEVEYGALGKAMEASDQPSEKADYYVLFAYSNKTYVIQGYDYDSHTLKSILSEGTWSFGTNEQIVVKEKGKSETQSFPYKEGEGFEVEAGDKIIWFSEEYVTEEFIDNFKYLPVTVSFDNLRVGSRAKVSAEVFYSIPGHGRQVVASGTSDNFVIEQNTAVTVKMKLKYSYEPDYPDNPDNPDYPDNPDNPDETTMHVYSFNLTIKGIEPKPKTQVDERIIHVYVSNNKDIKETLLGLSDKKEYSDEEIKILNETNISDEDNGIYLLGAIYYSPESYGLYYYYESRTQEIKEDGTIITSIDHGLPFKAESSLDVFAILYDPNDLQKHYLGLSTVKSLSAQNDVVLAMDAITLNTESSSEQEALVNADGKITTQNNNLIISASYGKIYRNNGEIYISAERADGNELSSEEKSTIHYNVKFSYGGNIVDENEGSYTFDTEDKKFILSKNNPLEKGGTYQLFVESSYTTDSGITLIDSQTFNVSVSDYLYYDCSYDSTDENYLDASDGENILLNKLSDLFNEKLYLKFSGESDSTFMSGILGESGLTNSLADVSAVFDFADVTGVDTINGENYVSLNSSSASKIEKIILPDSTTTIESGCFTTEGNGLSDSNIVLVLGKNVTSVTSPWKADSSPFKTFEVSNENTHFVSADEGKLLLSTDGKELVLAANSLGSSYKVPDSVTTIGAGAFCGCSTLKTLNFNNVTKIEQNAFKTCGLTAESDEPLTLGKVEVIEENAFKTGYKYVTLPATLKAFCSSSFGPSSLTDAENSNWEYVYGNDDDQARSVWNKWITDGNYNQIDNLDVTYATLTTEDFTGDEYTEGTYLNLAYNSAQELYFYRNSSN